MIIVFSAVVLLFSVIMHEIAHGSMAYYLGDNTAKYSGRLTINPLKHLDLFGSIVLPISLVFFGSPIVVGWAKPVPINPYNFRDQKWGNLKVSIAGPGINFLIAIIFGLIIRFLPFSSALYGPFSIIIIYNLILGIFNLIPIPPLDGSWILFSFLSSKFSKFKLFLHQYGTFILILLILFSGLNWIFVIARMLYALISGQQY